MLKIILLCGAPGSGKSTWANQEIAKDPDRWVRVNNDNLREMMNGTVFSESYEKIVSETRLFLIKEALKKDRNVIVDNINASDKHWKDVCSIAAFSGKDTQVIEKLFYIDLETAIERDAKREGKAKVGEEVVKKFWKALGGKSFQHRNPRTEIFVTKKNKEWAPLVQNENLPRAAIFDLDGTLALLNGRNPYDASTCDQDLPHQHVIECMRFYFRSGHKIILLSGREDKYREPTEKFCLKHFPEVEYKLFMRKTGDFRKDYVIKKEIFENQIKDNFNIKIVIDDRLSVCNMWYSLGLSLLRAGDPLSSF